MDTREANSAYLFLIFLISPFLSLIIALKNLKVRVISNVIWAFYTFFGYILVKSDSTTDVYRYSNWFESFSQMVFAEKLTFFGHDSGIDFFKIYSFHFVSFFTSSSRIYFAFIGFVFGFFYSRIIGMLLNNISKKMTFLDKLFVFSFIFILPFTAVQFVRFSTAIVVFLYFIFRYFLEGNSKKHLVLAGLGSLFIHFSFILPIVVVTVFLFLPKKFDIYFYAFVISSIFMIVEFSTLKELIAANLPAALESKQSYLNDDYAKEVIRAVGRSNWYIQYRASIVKYIMLFLLFYTRGLLKKGTLLLGKYKRLLLFGLFLGTIANIISVVPSASRFLGVAYPIIWLTLIIIHINNKQYKKNNYTRVILFLFFVFQTIVGFRYAADIIPIDFFTSNPIFIFLGLTDIPIIEYVK